MTANTSPIFGLTPNIGCAAPSAALTKSDGTGTIGTDIFKAFTAGANGAYVTRVRWNPVATAAATTTTATVGRVYVSSKTSGATTGGTDTFLVGEVALPAQSADHSTTPTNPVDVVVNQAIPAGWTILVSTHAAPAASTTQQATVYGADF